MPVKYQCPKCHRRFTEWGAEKVGFKCPHDAWCPKDAAGEIELVRGGLIDEKPVKKPAVKRAPKKLTAVEEVDFDAADEVLVPDIDEVEEVEEAVVEADFVAPEEDESPVKFAAGEDIALLEDEDEGEEVDLDVPVDLAFGDTPSHLGDEAIEDLGEAPSEWSE
ncbi:MAG: hypothetical protein HZB26_00060 [Candidatus Hydrogenedentes bacterium]|nr:hypothetical protein [Candidatus Hydrogenedentota bacterium]